MSITPGIAADGHGSFTATPDGVIPAGSVPQWTSSDVTLATVATPNPDATGLTTTLTGADGASGSVTVTIALTRPDSKIAQGSLVVPVTPGMVKSFSISQIA